MDLIDRDKLCRAISNDHSHNNAHNTVEELTVVLREINNAPTVDAVPVVHGRWEMIDKTYCICTICKSRRNAETQFMWYFCPKCGAKMYETD